MSGRWEVWRAAGIWWACERGTPIVAPFDTWREAMDFATSAETGQGRANRAGTGTSDTRVISGRQSAREGARRRNRNAEFLNTLDSLGADDDTRRALTLLVAAGMSGETLRRLGMAYAKGLRIEVVNDYYPGPGTPGVYGVRREP